MAGGNNPTASVLYALGANSSLAVAKGVAAFATGSSAMLAESVHSIADAGNQVLLLLGIKQSKKPPTPEYPLGYGKSTYFWSFLVAVILFTVGGMFSLYEGWHKLHEPEPLKSAGWAVGVLVFGIIVETVSLWAALREINKVRGERSYWRWFRESRQSALIVIFGEDLAALLGLVFALIAVLAASITGNPVYDAIGTLTIGVLLILVAVFVAIEVKALLIGQGVEPPVKDRMSEFIESQPEVQHLYNLVTLHMGPDVMVAAKAHMRNADSGQALVDDINAVEARFRSEFPEVAWLFFEPDTSDSN